MKNALQYLLWSMLVLTTSPAFAQNFNLDIRSSLQYPGQTLANIYGYAQNGKEYALVGASKGLVIVDVTNPDNPVNIVQLPGPDNLWKEIKTYGHYAYVTSEGGQGVQIVDLSALPSPNLTYHFYTGEGQFPEPGTKLNAVHALHIDTKKGFMYLYGGGLYAGGAKVFDLNADPYNPTYVGKYDALGYIHDGYAENDTLYACNLYAGQLAIVNMTDKANPQLLGTVQTPGKFTHNSWLLDDHKHILTTDENENAPSFVTCYDISDPEDIRELDRVSTNDGTKSIGHNTHVLNDWAITSWYSDGVVIADAHRPDNMVITGWYDTWPGTGANFDGCWGVYPFLPSGTIVASNIPNETGGIGKLFVLTPTYTRACYLEGSVTNGCNGQPMFGATIEVNSSDPWINTKTKLDGTFKTGQTQPGNFTVTVSKPGFYSKTVDVTLATAEVTQITVTLEAENAGDLSGTLLEEGSSTPVGNANFVLTSVNDTYTIQSAPDGSFDVSCVPSGTYQAKVSQWGYLVSNVTVTAGTPVQIYLKPVYYDDFEVDLGWSTEATASSGLWERGKPEGTFSQNNAVNPGFDVQTDNNELCYVTGNGGGSAGSDDVDDGSVTLTSPPMRLAAYQDATLSFWYWFYNGGGQGTPPNDNLEVRILNGTETVTLLTETVSQSNWRFSGDISMKDYINLTDDVRVQFIASDLDPGHFVEAGVDIFSVVPGALVSGVNDIYTSASMMVMPNPSATSFAIRYDWPGAQNLSMEVRNLLGQTVMTQQLATATGVLNCGETWTKGVYIVVLRNEGRQSAPVRLVKQ